MSVRPFRRSAVVLAGALAAGAFVAPGAAQAHQVCVNAETGGALCLDYTGSGAHVSSFLVDRTRYGTNCGTRARVIVDQPYSADVTYTGPTNPCWSGSYRVTIGAHRTFQAGSIAYAEWYEGGRWLRARAGHQLG